MNQTEQLRTDNWLANIRSDFTPGGRHRAAGEPRMDLNTTTGRHRA